MKKGLILCLALLMALSVAVNAAKIDPKTSLMTKDGKSVVTKAPASKGNVPPFATLINATGYDEAWRGTSAQYGKSIIVDPAGTNIGVAFGVVGTPCNLVFGYSGDGGATWGTQTIFTGTQASQTRIYPGAALDAAGNPYIVWQDRYNNSIQWSKDEGGIGGGLWTTPDTLARDTVAWYLPSLTIGGNKMMMSAFAHGGAAPAGDYSIHAVLSNDLGATWQAPWDKLPLPDGWNKWGYNEISGQGWDLDEVDWIFSPSGDTVIAFQDYVTDTMAYINNVAAGGGGAGYWPIVKTSFDGGITWSAPIQIMSETDLPQYSEGGWWYRFDGTWIGDRPYLTYIPGDGTWNGTALFEMHPTAAGDYSTWTINRISDIPANQAGVVAGDLNGGWADHSTISQDGSGNIFVTYEDSRKDLKNKQEIFGVASTDGGATWLNPVRLTNDTGWVTSITNSTATIYNEAAENVANGKIHMILHDVNYANMYYWSVSTATILAGTVRADEITLAPVLCGDGEGGWGGPIDATMDTVKFKDGDALSTIWSPSVAMGGTYQLQMSTDSTFAAPEIDTFGYNVNYLSLAEGLSDTNAIWYWRVRAHKVTDSPWSSVYDFFYRYQLNTPVLNLTMKAPAADSITLWWRKSLNSVNVDSYFVYRKTGAAGSFAQVATFDSSAAVNDTIKYYEGWALPHSPADTFYYKMLAKATVVSSFSDTSSEVSCVVADSITGVTGNPVATTVISKFSLNQSRPNPVNRMAELSFTLPRSGNYSLKIYNIAGQVIRTLDNKGNAGQNTVTWNGMDNNGRKVANGVYLYNLNAFGNSATKKLVVVR